jgi:hypothetical protein
MVLTPGQQKALFVLVVVVLGALGYFLVVPALHHSHATSKAAGSPTPPAAVPSAAAPAPAATESPGTAGATGGVNIYAWLPFTQQDLAGAAALTVRFAVDYNTYSYTQNPQAYVGTMNGLITTQLADTLKAAYATPGVAQLRKDEKQVSTGTAAIHSLRAFGTSSITFLVDTQQHLETSGGASNAGKQYAVTVTGSGAGWLVNDIEPADAGNS